MFCLLTHTTPWLPSRTLPHTTPPRHTPHPPPSLPTPHNPLPSSGLPPPPTYTYTDTYTPHPFLQARSCENYPKRKEITDENTKEEKSIKKNSKALLPAMEHIRGGRGGGLLSDGGVLCSEHVQKAFLARYQSICLHLVQRGVCVCGRGEGLVVGGTLEGRVDVSDMAV